MIFPGGLFLSCPAFFCLVVSRLVESGLILSCLVSSCLVMTGPILSCRVLSCVSVCLFVCPSVSLPLL